MLRAIALLLIGLAFGGAIGFSLGQSGKNVTEMAPAMEHANHAHVHGEPLAIEPGTNAPTVEISVVPDTVGGWNLNIQTTRFRFSAERAGAAHVDGEGHAHVYVNGEKIARAYSEWFHIDELPAGRVEIEVVLNSNDHRALTVGEVPVSASVAFDNPG